MSFTSTGAMPTSTADETANKPIARKSSDYIAGVNIPIKKRRFRIIRSPSPPPEESSLIPVDDDSFRDKLFCLSTLSGASGATSSGLSDTNKSSGFQEKNENSDVNMVPNDTSPCKLEVNEPILSSAVSDIETKLLPVEKFATSDITSGATQSQLAGNTDLAPKEEGKESNSIQNVGARCKLVVSAIPEDTKLSLGYEEKHLVLAKSGIHNDGNGQDTEHVETNLMNLCLSKGRGNSEGKSDKFTLNHDSDRVNVNRSNWDLNTLMDTWEMKNEESEQRSNIANSCRSSSQKPNFGDSLNLSLNPACIQSYFSQKPSTSFTNQTGPNACKLVRSSDRNAFDFMNLNSEKLLEDSVRQGFKGDQASVSRVPDFREVKHELVERCRPEVRDSSNGTLISIDPNFVKSEPFQQENHEVKRFERTSQQSDNDKRGVDNRSRTVSVNGELQSLSVKPTGSTELTITGDLLSCVERSAAPLNVGHGDKGSNVSGLIDTAVAKAEHMDDREEGRSENMNEHPDSPLNGDSSVSDWGKVNISADILEEDSCCSDYESDGNCALDLPVDVQQCGLEDDYEDGEVREPVPHTGIEGSISGEMERERVRDGSVDKSNMSETLCDEHLTPSCIEEEDLKIEVTGEAIEDHIKECVTVDEDKRNMEIDNKAFLQDMQSIEIPLSSADKKIHVNINQEKVIDAVDREDTSKRIGSGQLSHQTTAEIDRNVLAVAECADENVIKTDVSEKNDYALCRIEASLKCVEADKDDKRANRSRIINLSRASSSSSPGKIKNFPGQFLPSRYRGRSSPDVALEGNKFHRREREELFDNDQSHDFTRQRLRNPSYRTYRPNFLYDGRRNSSSSDKLHGDWNSGNDATREPYNFRVPRHKYASAVSDAEQHYRSYNIPQDDSFVGTDPGGKEFPSDEGTFLNFVSSRRWSTRGRGVRAGHSLQMIRRNQGHINSSGCIDEDGSELFTRRHSENFMGGSSEDEMERTKPPSEDFVRGNKNFSFPQRRGLSQIHSKSPIRSRSRSPSPWSTTMTRNPDVYGSQRELPHQRSQAFYRIDRMRSSDRPRFPEDVVVRRHGSPFLSRGSGQSRNVETGQEHRHPRSVIPGRSPRGRGFVRNRRFDHANPQVGTDDGQYFVESKHSGPCEELWVDGSEERRFRDQRGPIRPFRVHHNDTDGGNYQLRADDGRRPYKLVRKDDSHFNERGNMRGREFDGRIPNKSPNGNGRMRSTEEQEGDFRRGGQVWHGDYCSRGKFSG